jgi:hypothetical protein
MLTKKSSTRPMNSSTASSQTGQLKVNSPTGMSSRMTANSTACQMKQPNPGPWLGSRSSLKRTVMHHSGRSGSMAPGWSHIR